MARARKFEHLDLPNRWRISHGAYYYQVPKDLQPFWDNKQMYRLGANFDQAIREYDRVSSKMLLTQSGTGTEEGILDLPDVLSLGKRIDVSGVYFLIAKGELIYVGRSDSLLSRLNTHRGNKLYFDHVHTIGCTGAEQVRLEAFYIQKFRPRLNCAHL